MSLDRAIDAKRSLSGKILSVLLSITLVIGFTPLPRDAFADDGAGDNPPVVNDVTDQEPGDEGDVPDEVIPSEDPETGGDVDLSAGGGQDLEEPSGQESPSGPDGPGAELAGASGEEPEDSDDSADLVGGGPESEPAADPIVIQVPSVPEPIAYDGADHLAEVVPDQTLVIALSYRASEEDAWEALGPEGWASVEPGFYEATLELGDGDFIWSDGTAGAKTVSWEIAGAPEKPRSLTEVAIPEAVSGLVYTGVEQVGVPEGEGYVLTGTTAATDAGEYTATAMLADESYVWTDGTTDPKTITWSIAKKTIQVPSATSAFQYDGREHIPFGLDLSLFGDGSVGQLGNGRHQDVTTPFKVLDGIETVSLGGDHSAAIKSDGSLWLWGRNNNGQLGKGDTVDSSDPVKILDDVVAVSLGGAHSAAIKSDGSLLLWGKNNNGQLGNGSTTNSNTPVKVMDDVAVVSLGGSHSAAIKTDGSLWVWGDNYYGQLGNGTTADSNTPVKVMDDVVAVSLGGFHSAAIKSDGSLWLWGYNNSGQLGNGTTQDCYMPTKILDDVRVVSLGLSHSSAIKSDGSLWMWGGNFNGALGNGTTTNSSTPLKVMDDVAAVSLGDWCSAAIKSDGSLWMWGSIRFGESFIGSNPTNILDSVSSVTLSQNGLANCYAMVKSDGSLWMWGNDYFGQLGINLRSYVPVTILHDVAAVSLGGSHSAAVKTDGSLWVWGDNYYGQLGNGMSDNFSYSSTPIKILDDVKTVFLGHSYSAAIKADDSLWMWGQNDYGQLGNGTTSGSAAPIKILDDVAAVSLGERHSAAIKSDGSLWVWGYNYEGQLGNGRQGYGTDSLVPILILDHVVAVSLGGSHSAAIKSDGSLWLWGENNVGQLGNGTTTNSNIPVKVMDDVVAVSLRGACSAAIKSDGSLWTWGQNDCGQLGNGTIVGSSTPVKVLEDVTAVSLSGSHSAAIKTDGSLWTWGINGGGQLGDGTTSQRLSPIKVLDGVIAVSLGGSHSAVLGIEGCALSGTLKASQVGAYSVVAELLDPVNMVWSDGTTEPKTITWSIRGIDIDMSGVSFEDATFEYDGVGHSLGVAGELPEGVTVSYENNAQAEIGEYEVVAHFVSDNPGANPIPDMTATLKIVEAQAVEPVIVQVPTIRDIQYDTMWHLPLIDSGLKLYSFGVNSVGQLGNGSMTTSSVPSAILDDAIAVAAGDNHSAVIRSDNSLWMWGGNSYGQLGNGNTQDSSVPVRIMDDVIAVSLGTGFSAALKSDGSLWMWGDNSQGQLGIGSHVSSAVPVKVMEDVIAISCGTTFSGAIKSDGSLWMWGFAEQDQLGTNGTSAVPMKMLDDVIAVSLGVCHSAAIKSDGSLWLWGASIYGELGIGTPDSLDPGVPMKALDDAVFVALGSYFSAAIKSDGSLWMWGHNGYGQLGNGSTGYATLPVKIMDDVVAVSLGDDHSAAIKADGSLWLWGSNSRGQLGLDISITKQKTPVKVMDSVFSVSLGNSYSMILSADGRFAVDGMTRQSDTGTYSATVSLDSSVPSQWDDGTTEPKSLSWSIEPRVVDLPGSLVVSYNGKEQAPLPSIGGVAFSGTVAATDVGTYTAVASLKDGNYIWGDGSTEAKTVEWSIAPQVIRVPSETVFTYDGEPHAPATQLVTMRAGTNSYSLAMDAIVAASYGEEYNGGTFEYAPFGDGTYAAIDSDGSLWVWGSNSYGQYGIGTVNGAGGQTCKVMTGVVAASVGGTHVAAIKSDGSLWMWGDNSSGQLGIGSYASSYTPVKVMDGVVAVSLGYKHSAAIKSDGSLWMWGDNTFGQLGNGTYAASNTPIRVMDGVAGVFLDSSDFSAAIKSDGSLWMWGDNTSGQLGDGTADTRTTPIKIMDGVTFVAIRQMVFYHYNSGRTYRWSSTYAIGSDGSLYSWGSNRCYLDVFPSGYCLGDGMPEEEDRYYPEKILDNVTMVSASAGSCMAITSGGVLWRWGVNLGNSTVGTYSVPTEVQTGFLSLGLGGVDLVIVPAGSISGSGVYVATGDTSGIEVGTYSMQLSLKDPVNTVWDDGTTEPKTITWSIAKATYDMSGVTFADATFAYDGEAHSILIQGDLPEGVEVSYEGNGQTEPGTYTVTAHFTGDAANHEAISDMTATLTIEEPAPADPLIISAGSARVAQGRTASIEITVSGVPAAGIGGGDITVSVPEDSGLTIVSVTQGPAITDGSFEGGATGGASCTSALGDAEVVDGVLFTIEVAAAADAAPGTYELTVTVGELFDATDDLNYLDAAVAPGSITVRGLIWGDVDCSGSVTARDATFVARYSSGKIGADKLDLSVADVDGSGTYTARDATFIARRSSGRIDHFPVEE